MVAIHKENLPYEKFIKYGPESLTDAELLAIIIRTGTQNESSVSLGQQILDMKGNYWGLSGINHCSLEDLMCLKGIGEVKAVKIKCIGEIAKRISKGYARQELTFNRPETVAGYYMEELRHLETERVVLVMLDNKNRFLCDEVLSEGTVNMAILSPREVFLKALKGRAVNIMLLHNHPSGDPSPSREDYLTTQKMKDAADLVDIHLIDHIIIGDRRYVSFKEKGLL